MVSERFIWASSLIEVKPQDSILEIGCGTGILAEQILLQLDEGNYVALDRSKPMLEKAQKRNQGFFERGLISFENSDFLSSPSKAAAYDKIVAFNVNFFLKKASREMEKLARIIKPDGLIYVFYQAPHEISLDAAEPIKDNFLSHNFQIVHVELKELFPTAAICVVAKPNH